MPSLPDSNGNLSAQPNSTGTDDLFGAKPSQPSSDPFGNDDNPFGAKPAATAKAPAAKGPDPINDIFAGINAASSKPVGKGTDSFGLFGDVNKNYFKPQVNDPFGKPTSTLDPFSSSSNMRKDPFGTTVADPFSKPAASSDPFAGLSKP